MNESFETAQKFCPQCGEAVDTDARFCKYCAFDLANSNISQDISTEINQTRTKRNTLGILGAMCLLILGLIGVVIKFNSGRINQSAIENANSVSQASASTLTLGEKAQQIEEKILRGEALGESDLEGLSATELRILRNVHFARYGRKYEKPGLGDYFYSQTWYKPNDSFNDRMVTSTDKANIALILSLEKPINSETTITSNVNSSLTSLPEQTSLSSSEGKLSRSEATRFISSNQKFSEVIKGEIKDGKLYGIGEVSGNKLYSILTSLRYIEIEKSPNYDTVTLTSKGQKEAANWENYRNYWGNFYKIPYAKREIVEVTGISELKSDGNFAQATFTWHLQSINEIGKDMIAELQTYNADAFFQKFDDGWRVIRVSGRGIPGSE